MRTKLYCSWRHVDEGVTVAGDNAIAEGIVVDEGVTEAGDVVTAGGVVSVFQGKDGQNNDDLKDGTLLNKWYCQQCYGAGAAIF